MKAQSLGGLAKRMEELTKVSEELPAALREIRYDDQDPESIEAALEKCKQRADEEAAKYPNNTHVQGLTKKIKDAQHGVLSKKAEAARKT